VLDEQLVDAQESSTRYQDFTKRRYYTPPEIQGSDLEGEYARVCDQLFSSYRAVQRAVVEHYEKKYADQRPAEMGDEEYRRTVRARAFDVARYVLPSSTYTGLGYICSARTLERQIARLASSPLAEVREIAGQLREAVKTPAYNPTASRLDTDLQALLDSQGGPDAGDVATRMRTTIGLDAPAAPTLVRYTEPRPYLESTFDTVASLVAPLVEGTAPDGDRGVTLARSTEPPVELAASLIYRATTLSYDQILDILDRMVPEQIDGIGAMAFAGRGPHDEPVREARVGYQLVFDVCMDNGAFRDLHRHRNCIQIVKDFTPAYGYDVPMAVGDAGVTDTYRVAMDEAGALAERLDNAAPGTGQYALPLAYRRRALFKMDMAELGYIVETRSKPAGHFSYREISVQMLDEFRRRYPSLSRFIRATDAAVDGFFER
jgi:thymidylate synthase ThyX